MRPNQQVPFAQTVRIYVCLDVHGFQCSQAPCISLAHIESPADGRRSNRQKKVSQRMAVVDEATRQEAVAARLAAFESDHQAGFVLASD